MTPHSLKTAARALALAACLCAGSGLRAQSLPKTSDINETVYADGSVDLAFQMEFDASAWRQWKAMVGDEPARLRAMMRHQFAALTLENFKLERDDMNRVAKMSLHSPAGPELRDDGSFQVPVDGYFRLVNGSGRTWFFSGNNPRGGNALNNVKVTLPANALNAYVANPNHADQALVFALAPAPSPARWFYGGGAVVTLLGLAVALTGALARRRRVEVLPPATPVHSLPAAQAVPSPFPPPPQTVEPPVPPRGPI